MQELLMEIAIRENRTIEDLAVHKLTPVRDVLGKCGIGGLTRF
jgi:hypothetical protein